MRHRRLRAALLAAALMLLGGATVGIAPASADAPPTAENFYKLRQCESGDNYGADTGNGYYGAYQFDLPTWHGLGYQGYPHENPPEIQDEGAWRLYHERGWDPWPWCADRLGFR